MEIAAQLYVLREIPLENTEFSSVHSVVSYLNKIPSCPDFVAGRRGFFALFVSFVVATFPCRQALGENREG